MKHFSKLTIILILICRSQCYSQTNSQGLILKVKDLKTVEKNGKTNWIVKTTLTNYNHDTLFYFAINQYEPPFGFMLNSEELVVILISDTVTQTVIAIPPGGQRTFNLEIYPVAHDPVVLESSPYNEFEVLLGIYKANNMHEPIPDLLRWGNKENRILVASDNIKIKRPTTKSPK